MNESRPRAIYHAFGWEWCHRCNAERPGVSISNDLILNSFERFDLEGNFEVQLWKNADPVLFPGLFSQKDVIVANAKNPMCQFVRTI
jgi:hypothetical protein